jgi:hypothetical protein
MNTELVCVAAGGWADMHFVNAGTPIEQTHQPLNTLIFLVGYVRQKYGYVYLEFFHWYVD